MSFAPLSRRSAEGNLPDSVHRVVASSGKPLQSEFRRFYEPAFGHRFSDVRVHDGSEASASAKSIGSQAYTFGNHIVLGNRGSDKRLMAHELAHVAQQPGAPHQGNGFRWSNHAEEAEAGMASARALSGRRAPVSARNGAPMLARFSDNQHHIIEEAALPAVPPAARFTPEQMRAVEQGNVHRDYSQKIPAAVNLALVGKASNFGGYNAEEHFDNFIFDAVTDRWRTRGAGNQKFANVEHDPSPIDYISDQLTTLAQQGMSDQSLVHLGNAFHTVEDFFAHSNFMELARGDKTFGDDLITGSFGPNDQAVSLSHTLGAVSTPEMESYYHQKAEAATKLTEPGSHSRLAKDSPGHSGFAEARRLAALVIQELGAEIVPIMREKDATKRASLMNEKVISKIKHYLRPPDPKDKWWEGLIARGGTSMDARIAEAASRTPVTVNQALLSPLRNMEASKDSPMAIPFGLAQNLGGGTWLQAGMGATRPSPLDSRMPTPPASAADQKPLLFLGAQLTGHF